MLFDTIAEALEIVAKTAGVFSGAPLVFLVALLAFLARIAVGARRKGQVVSRLGVAYRIALGIGMHNLDEGLAIGAAFASGRAALGTFLIIGFTLHNITEGIGIAAPIARERPKLWHFVAAHNRAVGHLPGGHRPAATWRPKPTAVLDPVTLDRVASDEQPVLLSESDPDGIMRGALVQVVAKSGKISLRASADAGSRSVGVVDRGALMVVVDGPRQVGDTVWWKVSGPEQEGWGTADALALVGR